MKRMQGWAWLIGLTTMAACGGSTSSGGDGTGGDVDSGAAADTGSAVVDSASPAKDSASPGDSAGDTGRASGDTGAPATDTGGPATDSATSDDTASPTETGPVNDGVTCGTLTCFSPQICCIGFAGGASYDCTTPEACTGLKAKAFCDGPEDCTSGQVCCASFPSGDACKAACASGDSQLCHTDGDCKSGQTCKGCASPGGGPTVSVCVTGGACPF